jgi:hypothetical protein
MGMLEDCDDIGSKALRLNKHDSKLVFSRSMLMFSLLLGLASIFTMKGCRLGRQAVMTDRFCAI